VPAESSSILTLFREWRALDAEDVWDRMVAIAARVDSITGDDGRRLVEEGPLLAEALSWYA
jgi:hypothetical protein